MRPRYAERWLTGPMELEPETERDVAMFPLGAVLLPHMPLPLRIFEQRYMVMLGRLLDDEVPEFGVVLIERGHEAGGGDQRFPIGTMARIAKVAARAEEIELVAIGAERIEVVSWLDDDPHPRARVRTLAPLTWDVDLDGLRVEAERTVRRLLAVTAEFAETPWDADTELSDDPISASWQLAGIAPLGPIDQLRLLGATSARELLSTLVRLCNDAEPVLTSAPSEAGFAEALSQLLFEEGADGGSEDDDSDDDDADGGDENPGNPDDHGSAA